MAASASSSSVKNKNLADILDECTSHAATQRLFGELGKRLAEFQEVPQMVAQVLAGTANSPLIGDLVNGRQNAGFFYLPRPLLNLKQLR